MITTAWNCSLLCRLSVVGGAFEQEEAREKKKKKKVGRGAGGNGFQED